MRIPFAIALVGLALFVAPPDARAQSERAERVVIVLLDRVSPGEMLRIPAVREAVPGASFGLVSVAGRGVVAPYVGALSVSAGTRAIAPDPAALFLTIAPGPVGERLLVGTVGDAYAARTDRAPPAASGPLTPFAYPDIDVVREANARADVRASPGLLGETLEAAGLRASVATLDRSEARLAPVVVMDREGIVPHGVLMDRRDPAAAGRAFERALARGDVVAVDVGGAAAASVLLPEVLKRIDPRDALLVLSTDPPERVRDEHTWLAPILARGPGLEPGLLTSASTRREGVVSNVDLLPTVLSWVGADVPPGLVGQRIESRPHADPVGVTLARFDRFARVAAHRGETLRALSVLAILAMLAGAAASYRPVRAPFAVRAGLLAAAASPVVLLVEPLIELPSLAWTIALVLGASVATGIAGAAVFRRDATAFALVGAAAVAILLVDVVSGSRLGARSLLGFTVAGGTRFYGLASESMGVALGGLLVGLGAVVDRRPALRRYAYAAAAAAVLVFAAPQFGAKFGMLLTGIPAVAVAWTVFEGRRVTRETVLLTAAVVTAGVGLAAALGLLAGEAGSHIGVETRVIGESGAAAAVSVFLRRAGVALRLLLTFWAWLVAAGLALVVFAGIVRRARTRAAVAGRPGLRGTLAGLVTAGVAALAFNDAGAVIVATMVLVAGPAVIAELASAPAAPAGAYAGGPSSTRRRSISTMARTARTAGATT